MAILDNSGTDAGAAQSFERNPRPADRLASKAETRRRATTLEESEEQFANICWRFQTLVASSGAELCGRRPAPESWSAAECLQHLSLSADAYFPVWQQVIATAGPRKAEMNAPYAIDFWGRFLCWILEPPARIRSKTPVPFQPSDCGEIDDVLDGFLDRQERIVAALFVDIAGSTSLVRRTGPEEMVLSLIHI